MNGCVFYFSRTGNTKRLAQTIADSLKVPIYDLASTQPSTSENYDLLFLGTPVEGASPAKETISFIELLPESKSKKTILFCTNRIFGAGRALGIMEKMLESKGYAILLKVSKKGMKPEKEADFSEILGEIKKAMKEE